MTKQELMSSSYKLAFRSVWVCYICEYNATKRKSHLALCRAIDRNVMFICYVWCRPRPTQRDFTLVKLDVPEFSIMELSHWCSVKLYEVYKKGDITNSLRKLNLKLNYIYSDQKIRIYFTDCILPLSFVAPLRILSQTLATNLGHVSALQTTHAVRRHC